MKRIVKNTQYINETTIIGKARLDNVSCDEYCSVADNSFIVNSKIGRYTSIGRNSTIINAKIGNFCSISWNVTIGATQHYTNRPTTHAFYYVKNYGFINKSKKIVEIVEVGHDVWVGANAIIMPNIKIGNGAIIGAGAVVTKDVPNYAIVVGNPAKVLKFRFEKNKIEKLLSIEWWDWDRKKIEKNIEFFTKEF